MDVNFYLSIHDRFWFSPAVQGQVPHPNIIPEFLRSTSCGMTSAREKSLERTEGGRLLVSPRDFCDLPIRRDEGRFVNTTLVFKGFFFEKKGKKGEREGGDGRRRERRRQKEKKKESGEREEPALYGERAYTEIEWKDDERRWR
ncbi:hypothetical protein TNCV_3135881 [Trichonephila clavipes]|nr:hypothetical protein TNCV_3135881 [Trichonephila clavipes]